MKRDMDLVRQILLAVEARDRPSTPDILEAVAAEDVSPEKLSYHLTMLVEQAGFLKGSRRNNMSGSAVVVEYLFMQLTWDGNEFLDNIRDPEVWKRTKAGLAKVGGMGLEMLAGVAKAYAKELIKEKLGIDLG